MANISLEKSIRSCKWTPGWESRLQSDRFLNPNVNICVVRGNYDTAGRESCSDSLFTKIAGCNSAADRVVVENSLRPQYIEYVTLDAAGIRGAGECRDNSVYSDTICRDQTLKQIPQVTGQFGYVTGYGQNIAPNCLTCKPDQKQYSQYW